MTEPTSDENMTTSSIAAAVQIIRAAKAGDVSAATAIGLHTVGLDRDQLVSVLTLIFPLLAELYDVQRLSKQRTVAEDSAAFAALVAQFDAGTEK